MITVSIITVSYNSAKTIRDTIDSVRRQTYPHIEYIVVDGGSTDGTVDILRENDKIIDRWVSESDDGIYDAMNKGIEMSTGKIIGILNSDDVYKKGAVTKVVNKYEDSGCECVIYGDMEMVFNDGEKVISEGRMYEKSFREYEININHPTCFVDADLYNKYGVFDDQFGTGSDREIMMRFKKEGAKFLKIEDCTAEFGMKGTTSTLTVLENTKWLLSELKMLKKYNLSSYKNISKAVFKYLKGFAKVFLPYLGKDIYVNIRYKWLKNK